ncbi:hypothetical protein IF1G_08609 [Cordyceps javanica]|uniref:Uncharacterized protein n=1 Tax=Cordyceps javanica TaxID=43265 RepID=A0A545UTC7_9HYPO|nr:hypothetical protein IF1G_08609 [Cordyceps javanica]
MIWLIVALLLGLNVSPAAAAGAKATHSTLLYQHFFPAWNPYLQDYLQNACREQIANYRNATFSDPRTSYTVLDCLLKQFPEFRKAEMSAAAVVLGLAPTILQMISPRPSDTAMVALRRPVLALLLSAAAPATSCPPPGQYAERLQALARPLPPQVRGCFPYTAPRVLGYHERAAAAVVSAAQYAAALAAAANSAYRTYQLCVWTVCTFVPTRVYLPALWHAAVVLLHAGGWLAMLLSLRPSPPTPPAPRRPGPWGKVSRMLGREVMPGAFAEKLPVESRDGPALGFSLMTMALYVGVPIHILYGTMVLSSLAFVSAVDSLGVVAWYALSAVVSKGVVYFECAGIQAVASESLATAQAGQQMSGQSGPKAVVYFECAGIQAVASESLVTAQAGQQMSGQSGPYAQPSQPDVLARQTFNRTLSKPALKEVAPWLVIIRVSSLIIWPQSLATP